MTKSEIPKAVVKGLSEITDWRYLFNPVIKQVSEEKEIGESEQNK